MICENANSKGTGVIAPQCFKNEAEIKVKVIYNEVDSDTLNLCKECYTALQKDITKHNYTLVRLD